MHRFPWADFKGFGTLKEAEQFLLSRSSAAEQPLQPAAQQAGTDDSENRGLSWTTAVAGQQSTAGQTASSTDDVIVIASDDETEAAGSGPVRRKRKLESGPEETAAAPLLGIDPSLVYRLVSALGTCSALSLQVEPVLEDTTWLYQATSDHGTGV